MGDQGAPTVLFGTSAMSARATARVLLACCDARHYPQRGNDARVEANKSNACRRAFPMTAEGSGPKVGP